MDMKLVGKPRRMLCVPGHALSLESALSIAQSGPVYQIAGCMFFPAFNPCFSKKKLQVQIVSGFLFHLLPLRRHHHHHHHPFTPTPQLHRGISSGESRQEKERERLYLPGMSARGECLLPQKPS